MEAFWSGFEKNSTMSDYNLKSMQKTLNFAKKWGPRVASGIGITGGAIAGSGVGMLARSKFENRHLDERDKTTKDRLIGKAPLIGLGVGALLGGAHGYSRFKSIYKKNIQPYETMVDAMGTLMGKSAALLPSVKLRPHQEEAVQKAEDNGGSLLLAHATGTGKTLSGIAAFENLKKKGLATKAIVVVPAGLRSNFVDSGVKKFTNSSVSVYGPKNEKNSKGIGDKSDSTYNVVSYDLFREHGEKLLQDTGADTIICDEIHRVRGTEGSTYNKMRDLREKVKNAITLTGSIVNNEPNDVVPLLDITYGKAGHKLVSKDFFDKLFVHKEAVTKGVLNPKVYIDKKLKNKQQLSNYMKGKVDFIPHEQVQADMPNRKLETVTVEMSPIQAKLYDFSMSSVDPITRWKIRNNIPVGQREAQDAFSKLTQARQVSTDPSILDKTLHDKNPEEYSPKIKAMVNDLDQHLKEKDHHKVVVYGNLHPGQLGGIERALKNRGINYSTFYGTGQEGNTAVKRDQNIKDFQAGKNRVLLISSAGSEGLDLKNATMLQMAEGHFNPEKIQQAEARVRRMGSPLKEVLIKRYISQPPPSKTSKFLGAFGMKTGDQGVDSWVYNLAQKKDELNSQFRDVLHKEASVFDESRKKTVDSETAGKNLFESNPSSTEALSKLMSQLNEIKSSISKEEDKPFRQQDWGKIDTLHEQSRHLKDMVDGYIDAAESKVKGKASIFGEGAGEKMYFSNLGKSVGRAFGGMAAKQIDKRTEKDIEAKIKQMLLDRGQETLTSKKHYPKILAASKLDEKALDATMGVGAIASGAGLLALLHPKATEKLQKPILTTLEKVVPEKLFKKVPPIARPYLATAVAGGLLGLTLPPLQSYLKNKIVAGSVGGEKDLDIGINKYIEDLKKKQERKYKTSKTFVNEYETKQELGIDTYL